jgi:hypothetical protein
MNRENKIYTKKMPGLKNFRTAELQNLENNGLYKYT